MPVPTTVEDLSATASSNFPTGSEAIGISLDDYLRSHASIIRQVSDAKLDSSDLAASSGASLVGYLPGGTGAVSTTVQTKLRESVSVKDFGAVGNGVADDTVAIQNAVSSGANVIRFPAGNYKTSASINVTTNGVLLRGAGRMATKILPTLSTIDAFHFGGGAVGSGPYRAGIEGMQISNPRKGVWFDKGCTNCYARDLYITGAAVGIQNNGDYTVNPKNDNIITSLNRVEVENFTQYGFYFYHCGDTYISECQTTGSNLSGKSMMVDSGVTAIYASRCNFLSSATGIEINDSVGISPNPGALRTQPGQMFFSDVLGDTCTSYGFNIANGYQVTLTDCWGGGSTSGVGFNIGASSKEITLNGCRALGNSQHGIVIGANASGRVKIVGCHAYSNGYETSNNYDGIYVTPGAGNFLIEGCQAYNDTGMGLSSTQRYGINIDTGATDYFVVSGNVNMNNLTGGLRDASSGSNKQIFGNVPKEENSAIYLGNSSSALHGIYQGFTTWDPASCPDGAIQVVGVTVSGAAVGMQALASFTGITGAGWILTADITSANNASVTLMNKTGGTVDLASGTLRVIAFNVG